jgi:energy-coupling factor transport system permease protein
MRSPWGWITWLAATLVVLSTTRNPVYILITLAAVSGTSLVLQLTGEGHRPVFPIHKLVPWVILLATLFNMLTSHFGDTLLFNIPGKIPLLSGRVTLEAAVYGLINGLILTGILVGFSVLNQAIPVRGMISLVPRAFFPMAVVASIAVTYLPTTLRQFSQVREAQAIRGHQMRSLRDWLPLLMPLLVGGLEHAMQLAEAMTARGFASSINLSPRQAIFPRMLMLVGVVLLAAGWLLQLAGASAFGWTGILLGAGSILLGLWILSKHSPRTTYRRQLLSWQDGLGMVAALVVVAAFILPIPGLGRQSLYYDPYPRLMMPSFAPMIGFMMLGLLAPGFLGLKKLNQAAL